MERKRREETNGREKRIARLLSGSRKYVARGRSPGGIRLDLQGAMQKARLRVRQSTVMAGRRQPRAGGGGIRKECPRRFLEDIRQNSLTRNSVLAGISTPQDIVVLGWSNGAAPATALAREAGRPGNVPGITIGRGICCVWEIVWCEFSYET